MMAVMSAAGVFTHKDGRFFCSICFLAQGDRPDLEQEVSSFIKTRVFPQLAGIVARSDTATVKHAVRCYANDVARRFDIECWGYLNQSVCSISLTDEVKGDTHGN